MIDPRYISGVCFVFIGLVFLVSAVKILNRHPVDRVFMLGPFVTNAGQKVVLRGCYTALMIGVLGVTDGSAKLIYALHLSTAAMDILGTIVANLALIVAGCVAVAAWRVWHKN